MSSLFGECFGCTKKKKQQPSRPTRTPALQPPAAKKPAAPLYKLQTNVPRDQVQFRESLPDPAERSLFKYSCPICFRYFSRIVFLDHVGVDMLECIACKNYVCRLCADDIVLKPSGVRCPFCDRQPLILSDVSETEAVSQFTKQP